MSPRRTILMLAAPLAAALAAPAVAAPAVAEPTNANTFVLDLSCSDGRHYPITVVENAAQHAAAHLLDTNSVLIPTAFQFHFTVIDADGNVVDEVTPPLDVVQGRSGAQHDTMSCTFEQTQTEDLP